MAVIKNLPTLDDLQLDHPDAVMIATRVVDLAEGTPLAGTLPPWVDHAVIGRKDEIVMVVFMATPVEPASVMAGIFGDADAATVEFANTLDSFRREGWKVREPDPWEVTDVLDGPVPF